MSRHEVNDMRTNRGNPASVISRLGAAFCLAALPMFMSACVGYVEGDGRAGVIVPEPEVVWFGGYDGYYSRGYGYRGAGSRGWGGGRR
jgi:hypothetical protein